MRPVFPVTLLLLNNIHAESSNSNQNLPPAQNAQNQNIKTRIKTQSCYIKNGFDTMFTNCRLEQNTGTCICHDIDECLVYKNNPFGHTNGEICPKGQICVNIEHNGYLCEEVRREVEQVRKTIPTTGTKVVTETTPAQTTSAIPTSEAITESTTVATTVATTLLDFDEDYQQFEIEIDDNYEQLYVEVDADEEEDDDEELLLEESPQNPNPQIPTNYQIYEFIDFNQEFNFTNYNDTFKSYKKLSDAEIYMVLKQACQNNVCNSHQLCTPINQESYYCADCFSNNIYGKDFDMTKNESLGYKTAECYVDEVECICEDVDECGLGLHDCDSSEGEICVNLDIRVEEVGFRCEVEVKN